MMQVETKHNRIIAGAGEYLAVCMKKKHFKKNEIRKFFSIIHLKPCTECENLKNFDEFYKQKNSPDGLSQKCIKCVKKLVQEYKEKNRETVLQTKRNSFYKNKKIILEKQKQYYENNKEKIRNRITIWEEKNREKYLSAKKEYYEKNKDKIIKKQNKYSKEKRKSDPVFKLKRNIRKRIWDSITSNGYTKKSRTHEILGCDFESFKLHIERQFLPGMTWEKLGSEIHIDHIIPLASATTEEEVIALNHFTNLRPCWAVENLRKSDNIEFLI